MALSGEMLEKVKVRRSLPAPAARRAIRTASGLSQADVAQEVGVSTETISRWEAGTVTPQHRHLVTYAQVLDELRAL